MSKKIKYKKDKLPNDRIYPCSIASIKRNIKAIPDKYLYNLNCIKLSNNRKNKGLAVSFEDIGTIFIFAFPKSLFTFPKKDKPRKSRLSNIHREFLAWGASFRFYNGYWWIAWDKDSLNNYFLNHVLLHEIGHLYGDSKYATEREREIFAEKFANKFGSKKAKGSPIRKKEVAA